jgi:exosortase J
MELMSTSAETAAPGLEPLSLGKATPLPWCGMAALTVVGCLGIYREIHLLWVSWTTDPLRSIGMLIPPASVALTLLVWRQLGWRLRGTWWGLPVIALSYVLGWLRQDMQLFAVVGRAMVSFIPLSLPVYVYASGVVLLFAGTHVWRRAWFPLGLLLLSQPVPGFMSGTIDLPLQNISARVARAFATLIHFAPTTPQLRLMFSPNFGMFIAPGCDGIRGAVTMGYMALVLGYLKRVSLVLWAAYVCGAVLLGYVFNFVRLCVLVIYYRIALGHPTLEGMAKQADYGIGCCLFLIAIFLFLWVANRKQVDPAPEETAVENDRLPPRSRIVVARCTAFAVVLLGALSLPSSAVRYNTTSRTPASLAGLMPKQVGAFSLTRTWYEQEGGTIVLDAGAYSAPGSDEIVLGVWVAPLSNFHDPRWCWLARGLQPDVWKTQSFAVAGGKSLALNAGFYSDGISNSIVVNAACTPATCLQFANGGSNGKIGLLFLKPQASELAGSETHPVSIMVRIDRLQSDAPKSVNYDLLSDEAEKFLSGLDPMSLSRTFQ